MKQNNPKHELNVKKYKIFSQKLNFVFKLKFSIDKKIIVIRVVVILMNKYMKANIFLIKMIIS
jgi:hypothetical protein